MATPIIETSVLIVGAGPAGLVTALGLARLGIDSILVERHPGTAIHPRASGVNLRTMEILRHFGLESAVRAVSIDAEPIESIRPALIAPETGVRRSGFPLRHEALAISPTWVAACPQDVMEPVILNAAKATGRVGTWFGREVESITQFEDHVESHVRNRVTSEVTLVRSHYVVGADGTRSAVRKAAGIAVEYLGEWGMWQSVLFRAPLSALLMEELRVIYMISSMERATLMLPVGSDDRWQLAHQMAHPDDVLDEAGFISTIRQATGVDDLPVEVISLQKFELVAEIAERYRERRLFLVGDAAHRMTPSGGAGMNSAIQAAHNLAWKLAYVLNGWAGDDLLDTYEAERRPIGERNARRSVGAEPERRPDGFDIDVGISYASEDEGDHRVRFDARPGTRAPHFWLWQDGVRLSGLDLLGEEFVLIAGPEGEAWRDSVPGGVPLRSFTAGIDFQPEDPAWIDTYGIDAAGAVLVRPDGFVTHRWVTQPSDPTGALRDRLALTLAWEAACVPA